MKALIFAIPGFLGLASDWNDFQDFIGIDPYQYGKPSCSCDLDAWARSFNNWAEQQSGPRFLVGYSMGGRLALQALTQRPDLYEAAVIISAHPGLSSNDARLERKSKDEIWAQKFLNEPWDSVMTAWNQQPVFKGSSIHRSEADYQRDVLAATLHYWGLASQEDLKPQLSKLSIPILYIAGEQDSTYVNIGKELAKNNQAIHLCVIPNASHRVPWEQSQLFTTKVTEFFQEVYDNHTSHTALVRN